MGGAGYTRNDMFAEGHIPAWRQVNVHVCDRPVDRCLHSYDSPLKFKCI